MTFVMQSSAVHLLAMHQEKASPYQVPHHVSHQVHHQAGDDVGAAIDAVSGVHEHPVAAAALGDVLGHAAVLAPAAVHCKLTPFGKMTLKLCHHCPQLGQMAAFGKMTLKLCHHCQPLGMSVPSCCLMPLKLHHLHCSESP